MPPPPADGSAGAPATDNPFIGTQAPPDPYAGNPFVGTQAGAAAAPPTNPFLGTQAGAPKGATSFWEGMKRAAEVTWGGLEQGAATALHGVAAFGDLAAQGLANQIALSGTFTDPLTGVTSPVSPDIRAGMQHVATSNEKGFTQSVDPTADAIRAAGVRLEPANRSWFESLIHTASTSAPGLATAMANPAAGASIFGMQGYGEAYDEAKAKGASEEVAQQAGLENFMVAGGATVIPFAHGLSLLAGRIGGAAVAKLLDEGAKGAAAWLSKGAARAAGDAAMGATMQTGSNMVAEANYDPDRPVLQSVPEQAGGFALFGAAGHVATGVTGAVFRPRAAPAGATEETGAPPLPGEPPPPPPSAPPPAPPGMPTENPGEAYGEGHIVNAFPSPTITVGGEPVPTVESHLSRLAALNTLIPHLEGGLNKDGTPRVSPKGAVGEYQVMPSTARDLMGDDFDTSTLYDPEVNRQVGQRYIAKLYKEFDGDVNAVLIAYNGGPGRAMQYERAGPGTALEAVPNGKGGFDYQPVPAARDESFLPKETQRYLADGRRRAGETIAAPQGAEAQSIAAQKIDTGAEAARIAQGVDPDVLAQANNDVGVQKISPSENLLGAIRRLGGVRTIAEDGTREDMADVFNNQRKGVPPGAVNNKTGRTPEQMREALQEEGWFGVQAEQTDPNAPRIAARGDTVDELQDLVRQHLSGATVYHPESTSAEDQRRNAQVEDEKAQAGVMAGDAPEVAAARLAAWRTQQMRESAAMVDLRAQADALGVPHDAYSEYHDLLADVLEREAIQNAEAEPDWHGWTPAADHGEELIHGDLNPEERQFLVEHGLTAEDHAWLDRASDSPFAESEVHAGPGEAVGGPEAHGEAPAGSEGHGPGPGGGGENAGEGAGPTTERVRLANGEVEQGVLPGAEQSARQAAAAREGPLRARTPQEEPGGLFAPPEPEQGAMFKREAVFYSALERHIETSKTASATPEQWKATIDNAAGVKKEEVEWSGVKDWLDMFKGQKVSKEAIQAFLKENGVKVDEVVLGTPTRDEVPPDPDISVMYAAQWDALNRAIREYQDQYGLLRADLTPAERDEAAALFGRRDELHDWMVDKTVEKHGYTGEPTRYDNWTSKGGEDYRELLLTLPKEADPPATHWSTSGVMAHVRFDTRTDADGKKTIFVQEVQSDWHQKGRDEGYRQAPDQEKIRAAFDARTNAKAALEEAGRPLPAIAIQFLGERLAYQKGLVAELRKDPLSDVVWPTKRRLESEERIIQRIELAQAMLTGDGAQEYPEEAQRLAYKSLLDATLVGSPGYELTDKFTEAYAKADIKWREAENAYSHAQNPGGIPEAPFKTTWPALVMKRVIRWAVDHGAERVAWTTGDMQNERYKLENHISRIGLTDNASGGIGHADLEGPFNHGTLRVDDHSGNRVIERHVHSREEMEGIIGRELTDRLLDSPATRGSSAGIGVRIRTLSGLDVKTGGEGMRAFYDRNLVNITNDLIKRYGAKVGKTEINTEARDRVEQTLRWARESLDQAKEDHAAAPSDYTTARLKRTQEDFAEAERAAAGRGTQVHSFDVTPQMAEAASGGLPLFRREEGAPQRGPQEERLVRGLRGTPAERGDSGSLRDRTIQAIDDVLARIAPQAIVRPMESMYAHGGYEAPEGYATVGATFRKGLHQVIAWSLETGDPFHTAYHEAIHALRAAGLFAEHEWAALEDMADKEWIEKYNIKNRYPSDTPRMQREEAIAEAFADWRKQGKVDYGAAPPEVRTLFQRIGDFLKSVGAAVRKVLGDKTADDIAAIGEPAVEDLFNSIARGEVGSRGAPVRSQGVRFARAPTSSPVPKVFDRIFGKGPDEIGAKVDRSVDGLFAKSENAEGIRHDLRMGMNPMATGDPEMQAEAKGFANILRAIGWAHTKLDAWLVTNFDKAARQRMWEAADEESVIRQRGDTPQPGEGLSKLDPRERDVVLELQARADRAFAKAVALGMTEAHGLPSYVPRMLIQRAAGIAESLRSKRANGQFGEMEGSGKLTTFSNNLRQRKYLTTAETEAAAKEINPTAEVVRDIRTLALATRKLEQAVAGRVLVNKVVEMGKSVAGGLVTSADMARDPDWTTWNHPALKTWKVEFVMNHDTGKVEPKTDQNGAIQGRLVPIYVHKSIEGPMKAVLSTPDPATWRAIMTLKSKAIGAIMYNPLTHNMVIWGKAFAATAKLDPLAPVTFRFYRSGYLVKQDPELSTRAIRDGGLVPINHNYVRQEVGAIADDDIREPGQDQWSAQLAGAIASLFGKGLKEPTVEAMAAFHDFVSNRMLWDQVANLQFGLWKEMTDHFQANGFDQLTADRMAGYFANSYAGSVPPEAMSKLARGILNGLLFSRSFHATNIGQVKAIIAGLPTDVQAQIMRDAPKMLMRAQSETRAQALSTVLLDTLTAWSLRALGAMAIAWVAGQVVHWPWENERGKTNKVMIGHEPDNTAVYINLPVGKFPDEITEWGTEPVTYAKTIMFGIPRLAIQYFSNDMGYGKKAYDDVHKDIGTLAKNVWEGIGHVVESVMPMGTLSNLANVVNAPSSADRATAAHALVGQALGFTVSHGFPGGPEFAELEHAKAAHELDVKDARPKIVDALKRGDYAGAEEEMDRIHMLKWERNSIRLQALEQPRRAGKEAVRDFKAYGSPEAKEAYQREKAEEQPQNAGP